MKHSSLSRDAATSSDGLRTVEKAVDVLFHLHGESAPQGVTAIAEALGLPKSSTHRLLSALRRRGLVERDERRRYRTGIGLVALGLGALESEPIVLAARPVLEAEAAAIGETFFLVAARAGRLVVIEKAEGTGFLRAAPRVGSSVPVHATAVGKLFLAFGRDAVDAPTGPYERFSEHTCGDAEALADEVERARARGFAENHEEWVAGLSVLAAPVFAGDRMLAAVAVASSSQRLRSLGTEALARRLLDVAGRIAARLEGRGR